MKDVARKNLSDSRGPRCGLGLVGLTLLLLLVGEGGLVPSACAEGGGHPALKQSAEWAAYGARFTPTTLGGKPVKVRGVIAYNFLLR